MIVKSKFSKNSIEKPFFKAAVDVRKRTVALGGELHVDCAEELTNAGSAAGDVWGINIYPDGRIDFISLINVRPAQGNRSMEIQDGEIKKSIEEIIKNILE